MTFRQRLGLDPTTTKELSTFLGGKPDKTDENETLFLNMRSDIRTREQARLLMMTEICGNPKLFNSKVARIINYHVLTTSIGFKGKRAELIAQVMAMGNIQNERRTTSFDFSRVEEKD